MEVTIEDTDSEDDGVEDEPWSHLEGIEGMWKISEEEKTFWTEAQQYFDEQSFKRMQKKRIAGGVPFDFFRLREEIKESGYNPRMVSHPALFLVPVSAAAKKM